MKEDKPELDVVLGAKPADDEEEKESLDDSEAEDEAAKAVMAAMKGSDASALFDAIEKCVHLVNEKK